MLQRIQTVYLALALIAMGITLGMDWVTYRVGDQTTTLAESGSSLILWVLIGFSMFMTLVTIAFYKQRQKQQLFANLAMLDAALVMVAFSFMHYNQIQEWSQLGELEMQYDLASAMPLISIVLIWLAKRGIKKDDDLVKSVDRLR